MKKSWGFRLCASAVVLFGGVAAAQANFITNPGLTPSVKLHDGIYSRSAKSTKQPLTGWTVSGAIDIANKKRWQPGTSGFSVDLIGSPGLGSISQTITGLTAGDTYSFTFDIAPHPGNGTHEKNTTKQLQVTLDGTDQTSPQVFSLTNADGATKKNMMYQLETITFVAQSSSVTLTLEALQSLNLPPAKKHLYSGPVVTNLDMELVSGGIPSNGGGPSDPAPEPASLALLGIGGVALLQRRKSC